MDGEVGFATLVQSLGIPVAMLVTALVTVLNYFINGKVVPRWTFDSTLAGRDAIIAEKNAYIAKQAEELAEARKLIYSFANAAERGAKALRQQVS